MPRPPDDAPTLDPTPATMAAARSGDTHAAPGSTASRYAPGAIVAARYRIVALIGRGGMGEIYRADDLTLDHPVALKFLPAATDKDPARLAQFHNELRIARQVSHKNVCRLYDLGETDGRRFLTMEYIDGEDLAVLLRRIGRFPQDRAIAVARQLCAGVAAAHECGVIHRDLKPANVMLDREGNVRITDFGIATAVADVDAPAAGTPQYMAPEQLNGASASTATDIYALGLVLFEVFTGKRVHEAQTFAELRALHDTGTVTTPSSIVRDLDSTVERVILRCLDVDPQRRPSSALAVAGALPGGQPLDEVLASGATPSPALLASVAESDAMPLGRALLAALAVLLGVGLFAALAPAITLARQVPLDKPPAVLADRAEQILASVGLDGARGDSAEGFAPSSDYIGWIAQADRSPQRWQRLFGSPALYYWHRTSPRELVPRPLALRATLYDPPPAESGMQTVTLDTRGRLLSLTAVPPQFDPDAASPASPHPPWPQLFQAAALDLTAFSPVAPQWNPRDYADARSAWEGPFDGGVKVRVEASSYRGRPVSFAIVGPWTRPTRMQTPSRPIGDRIAYAVVSVAALALIAGAILLARHNLRASRADAAGATRLAAAVVTIEMAAWLFGYQHAADVRVELGSFMVIAGDAVFVGVLLWVAYVAIEPYCRRWWPNMLLGWSRLLTGHIRDARVGRDVLIGLGAAVLWLGIDLARRLLPQALGYPAMPLRTGGELNFAGAPCGACNALSTWSILAVRQFIPVFLSLLLFLVLRLVTRSQWKAITLGAVAIFYWWSNFGPATAFWIEFAAEALIVVLFTAVMIRGGILPALVALFVVNVCQTVAMTLDVTHWSATTSNLTLVLIIAVTLYAFVASRTGEPILGRLPTEI